MYTEGSISLYCLPDKKQTSSSEEGGTDLRVIVHSIGLREEEEETSALPHNHTSTTHHKTQATHTYDDRHRGTVCVHGDRKTTHHDKVGTVNAC